MIHQVFYFIRHGQTDWNLEHRAMGTKDIPLNSYGITQSKKACEQLKGLSIQTICYSPLKRAKQTAEILNEELGCHMEPIEELKEFCLGTYGGQIIGDWFDNWMKGTLQLTEGESFQQFVQRALIGVDRALLHESPVLIVGHGGTYWAIQQALQLPGLPDLPNCSLACFYPPGSKGKKGDCIFSQSEGV